MQRAAAELALSCLNHCYSLKANDIRNALVQCRDYSPAMLEKACNAVEISALETGRDRPIPEALFETSKQWEWLFAISQLNESDRERAQINPQQNIVNAQRPNFSFSRLDDPVQPVIQNQPHQMGAPMAPYGHGMPPMMNQVDFQFQNLQMRQPMPQQYHHMQNHQQNQHQMINMHRPPMPQVPRRQEPDRQGKI